MSYWAILRKSNGRSSSKFTLLIDLTEHHCSDISVHWYIVFSFQLMHYWEDDIFVPYAATIVIHHLLLLLVFFLFFLFFFFLLIIIFIRLPVIRCKKLFFRKFDFLHRWVQQCNDQSIVWYKMLFLILPISINIHLWRKKTIFSCEKKNNIHLWTQKSLLAMPNIAARTRVRPAIVSGSGTWW